MTKRKKRGPTLEQQIQRPWCYYCERDFDDMMILTSHQKAKHFKCDKCGRRLNTAGGLSVHMNQVHKEPLERVENALPNRTDPTIEIFGTEGIPEEATRDHIQRVIEQYHRDAADRQALTGNLQPGAKGAKAPKRPKLAEQGDLKERLKQHASAKANGQSLDYEMQDAGAVNGYQQPYTNGMTGYQQQPSAQQSFAFSQRNPSPGQGAGIGQPPPQRPPPGGPPGAYQSSALLGSAMADAPAHAAEETGKKIKKEKGTKMVYGDNDISPEEKMSRMAKYAFNPAEHQPVVLGQTTGGVAGAVHGYEDAVDTKQ